MRDIKFRAWDMKNDKWALEGFSMLGEVMIFDLLRQYKLEEHCDLIIEQYTGLKDKNGKEIYEGDIVHVCQSTVTECVTRHEGGMWMLGYGALISPINRDCEIIGNKHKNPELLQNK